MPTFGPFGQLTQLGYVVRDLDRAMRYWTETLGIGPFLLIPELTVPETVYRGQTRPMTIGVAYSHSGGVQIELVRPADEPSIFQEALQQEWAGLHHVGYMVDDYSAAIASAEKKGFEPIQSGTFGGTSFAYYNTGDMECGGIVELTETSQAKLERFEKIRAAAEAWDGLEPIRVTPAAQLSIRG